MKTSGSKTRRSQGTGPTLSPAFVPALSGPSPGGHYLCPWSMAAVSMSRELWDHPIDEPGTQEPSSVMLSSAHMLTRLSLLCLPRGLWRVDATCYPGPDSLRLNRPSTSAPTLTVFLTFPPKLPLIVQHCSCQSMSISAFVPLSL